MTKGVTVRIKIYNKVNFLCPLAPRHLQKVLAHMVEPFLPKEHSVHLYVVYDAHMLSLQKKHMFCQGPTNILSFPAISDIYTRATHMMPCHTLVLSVDTLHRECFLYGQEKIEHTIRLLAHGIGHILGYEHGAHMFALCAKLEQRGMSFI